MLREKVFMKIHFMKPQCHAVRRFHKDTSGAFMILAALSLLALLGLTGLVVDGGRAMLERDKMQNAADLASLAATATYVEKIAGGQTPPDAYAAAAVTAQRYFDANVIHSLSSSKPKPKMGLVNANGGPGSVAGFGVTVDTDVHTTFAKTIR